MPLALSIATDESALARLAPAWSELLTGAGSNEPMQSPLWLGAWWRIFGESDGRKLALAQLWDGARLVGLLPLVSRWVVRRPGVPFRRLELLGSGEEEVDEICSEYLGPIALSGREEEVAEAFSDALFSGALGRWDELLLPAMDGSRPLPQLLSSALTRRGIAVALRQTSAAPYIALPSTFSDYLERLPSSHRYTVKRSLKDFSAHFGSAPEMKWVASRAELVEGQRILESLHGERWGERDGEGGLFRSLRFSAFHREVMPALLDQGALELGWLHVRGEPIAATYNLVWDGKVSFYQSGRKLDLPKKIRPGIVLHALAIERAIKAGRREYDFLAGDSQYKLTLALATRPLVELRAVRAPLRERVRLFGEMAIARARTIRSRLRGT